MDPRRGRRMKVTSSAFRGDQDSTAALLRKKRSSGNFIPPPGVKAGGNFSSELSKNMEKGNSVRIGLAESE